MANDVKWIKITTDIFDDEKILMIESMPSADSIIVIWFKLLTLAGKQNNNGVFLMSNRIAYTDEMLASIFRRDITLVRLALKVFEQFGMIEIIDSVITIPNWGKHQALDAYERKKARDREWTAKKRAEQRALAAMSSDSRPTSRPTKDDASSAVGAAEEDKERDKEREREKEIYKEKENTFSAAPQSDATPPVISLLLNDGSLFGIHQDKIDRWAQLYPAVDIMTELRKMAGWCEANPNNRKTRNGILRFITNWLSRSQDRAKPEKADEDKPFQYDYGDMGWSM